jgi:hypothetical protein
MAEEKGVVGLLLLSKKLMLDVKVFPSIERLALDLLGAKLGTFRTDRSSRATSLLGPLKLKVLDVEEELDMERSLWLEVTELVSARCA